MPARHCTRGSRQPSGTRSMIILGVQRITRAQRSAIVGVALVAVCLFGYGAAGSYTSVTHLAAAHHVPLPRLVPVCIDGGLVGTVLLILC